MTGIVLDTSALIAGLLAKRGAAAELIDAFFGERLRLYYTPATLAEYAEVMERPKFQIERNERISLLLKLRISGQPVVPATTPGIDWPDPDDIAFAAAALATPERILVMLNPRDFVPAKSRGVRVLSPRETIELLR